MVKILILCAGSGSRWGDYLGIPKQLIRINKETLLDRTIRLLHENGKTDIECVSNDDRLQIKYCGLFKPSRTRWIVETIISTAKLWEKRTIILLGDVFYTKHAMQHIANFCSDIGVFGRPRPSRYTKCDHGEIFAINFTLDVTNQLLSSAQDTLNQAAKGAWGNLWDLYHSFVGLPLNSNLIESKVFHTIDDFTDDFDTPEDYDKSIHRYNVITYGNYFEKLLLMMHINILAPVYYFRSIIGWRNFKRLADKVFFGKKSWY